MHININVKPEQVM